MHSFYDNNFILKAGQLPLFTDQVEIWSCFQMILTEPEMKLFADASKIAVMIQALFALRAVLPFEVSKMVISGMIDFIPE